MDDLALLMALRVQGLSSPERAAIASGTEPDVAAKRLAALTADEIVTERTGKRSGFSLTKAGLVRLDELLASEGLRAHEGLGDCYDRFLLLNRRVIALCSDWQLKEDDEAGIIERLVQLHGRAGACVTNMADAGGRFAPYGPRLDDCVQRVQAGDRDAFTALMAESYHTVWFELHQDLLLTLGRERED